MSWNSFKDVANKVIKQRGLSKHIEESLVLQSANQLLDNFFSGKDREKVSAVYFRAGILNLAVLDDSLLQKLIDNSDLLVDNLNEQLGDFVVDHLNFLS